MSIRGSVDMVTTKEASGWAYEQGRSGAILVQASLSNEVIGDAIATEHRPDLAAVGLGKGDCGYHIIFYREIDPLYLPFISVKVDGGDVELPRVGALGFGEFFTAFHRAHPAAGRSRSVLGGLWTDRTDAAAILKAKVELGQIAPDIARAVGQLIHLGIAVLEPADAPARPGQTSNGHQTSDGHQTSNGQLTAARIAELVETPSMLAMLRAVLDDNPLVLGAEICAADTTLIQPSAENLLPSAAECVVIAAPAADRAIAVDIVRDSHLLPEFTAGGISRWASGQAHAGIELAAAQQSLMTRYDIAPGAMAIIGPGTIYRLRCAEGAASVKLCCVPARATPLAVTSDGNRHETVLESGIRLWS